jgi:predicted flap endonuclease-1-like 5' DNA nuclease
MRVKRGLLNWVWSLTRVSVVIFLLWMWLRYQDEREISPTGPIEIKGEEPPQPPSSKKPDIPVQPAATQVPSAPPDDLTRIKGIGPKTAKAFQKAGISSYRQLAETSIQEISAMLEGANYRLLDPSTWIEQARLAANGQWEELARLQEAMKTSR